MTPKDNNEQRAKHPEKSPTDKLLMPDQQYWQLIANSRQAATSQVMQEKHLIATLKELPIGDIVGFYLQTRKLESNIHTSKMWCAANIMMGFFCSDDSFDYFKAWLVSRGKETYTEARENPDSLINEFKPNRSFQFEVFDYIPMEAFELKTARNFYDQFERLNVHAYPAPEVELDWSGNRKAQRRLCPNLYSKVSNELGHGL